MEYTKLSWHKAIGSPRSSSKTNFTALKKYIFTIRVYFFSFICDLCNHATNTKHGLNRHMRSTHLGVRAEPKYYFCDICNDDIKAWGSTSFTRHKVMCNGQAKIKFINQCCQCQQTFETEAELREHFDSVHGVFPEDTSVNKKKKWSCKYCHRKFVYKISLAKHCMDKDYKEKPNYKLIPVVCDECGKSFNTTYLLNVHKVQHRKAPGLPKTYKCKEPDCDKAYAFPLELKRHMKYHQEKRFKCHLCDFAFFDSNRIQQHVEVYHKDGLLLTCSVCFATFISFDEYKEHLEVHK